MKNNKRHAKRHNIFPEDDVDEGRDREDVGDRGERRVLAKGVAGESGVVLDKALRAHVLERGTLGDDESNLRELGREEQTSGVAEGVALQA